tara:strand:- start:9099 stop:9749 length:651 start_codon:yes stop_codon:yes gene_type:complete
MSSLVTGDQDTPAVADPNLIEQPSNETLVTAPAPEAPKAEGSEEGTTADGADSKADVAEIVGAPDAYEAFTLPEGFALNEEFSARFAEAAKGMNLTQDQAQSLVDLQAELSSTAGTELSEGWTTLKAEWQAEAKSDKEYGGKDFDASIGSAKLALQKYGTPELNEAIELTGMGNHPEFIRLLVKVGSTLKEDTLMVEGGQPVAPQDRGKVMFPDMN